MKENSDESLSVVRYETNGRSKRCLSSHRSAKTTQIAKCAPRRVSDPRQPAYRQSASITMTEINLSDQPLSMRFIVIPNTFRWPRLSSDPSK